MPYKIRKLPKQQLYKVYGERGNPLSKKGLPLARAKKQLTAVNLSELRQQGRIPPRKVKK
jgi:hypothetical protein